MNSFPKSMSTLAIIMGNSMGRSNQIMSADTASAVITIVIRLPFIFYLLLWRSPGFIFFDLLLEPPRLNALLLPAPRAFSGSRSVQFYELSHQAGPARLVRCAQHGAAAGVTGLIISQARSLPAARSCQTMHPEGRRAERAYSSPCRGWSESNSSPCRPVLWDRSTRPPNRPC